MNRSLTIIFIMGVIAMVVMTMFASFFVGKVGGAESIATVRRDLEAIFGHQMADPAALEMRVVKDGDRFGILCRYAPAPGITKRERALDYHMRRVSDFILTREKLRKQVDFVDLELEMPGGKTRAERFARRLAPDEQGS